MVRRWKMRQQPFFFGGRRKRGLSSKPLASRQRPLKDNRIRGLLLSPSAGVAFSRRTRIVLCSTTAACVIVSMALRGWHLHEAVRSESHWLQGFRCDWCASGDIVIARHYPGHCLPGSTRGILPSVTARLCQLIIAVVGKAQWGFTQCEIRLHCVHYSRYTREHVYIYAYGAHRIACCVAIGYVDILL